MLIDVPPRNPLVALQPRRAKPRLCHPVTRVRERRTDSATSQLRGTVSGNQEVWYDQQRGLLTSKDWIDDGQTATRTTTSNVTATVEGGRKTFSPPGSANPGQVVADAWFTMNAGSGSTITNSGVRGANGSAGSPYSGSGEGWAGAGWAWATTGSQSSTLDESVGLTTESASSLVSLQKTTSATELGSSVSVLRTDSGGAGSGSGSSSGSGGSGSTTSTMGSYSSTGMSGIYSTAYALVPVGADGLGFALGGTATNLVGDYLISAGDDLLGSGSDNPPGAESFTRGYGTPLSSQTTLPAPAGAAATYSGSGSGSSSSSGSGEATAYGGGTGGAAAGTTGGTGTVGAGYLEIQTAGQIIGAADAAAVHSALTNAGVNGPASLIVCDGGVAQTLL